AEDVVSDLDSPPYDKSLRDGYAVAAADFLDGPREVVIVEEVVAGNVPSAAVQPGQATRIMTGAPIPQGADAVVMFEDSESVEDSGSGGDSRGLGRARIAGPVEPGQWIMRRGQAMRQGDVVLQPGTLIRPVDVGLLSEVGRASVQAIRQPSAAVLPTGDEIEPPDQTPGPGRIRNSNGPMLEAAVRRAGANAVSLGVGPDDLDAMRPMIAAGLQEDVLILCGGVSAGTRDLVPQALAEQGVRQVFHKIQMKPGKPLWFGVHESPDASEQRQENGVGRGTLVFGLPGNPVSGLVCFELFVRPALRRLAGDPNPGPDYVAAELTAEHRQRGDREAYQPAFLVATENGLQVAPVSWQGSPDLRGVARANALIRFPAGDRLHAPGQTVQVLRL
ncbi:MAG: molybdopterin molybdotransferase MoeA, partial [Planctomycetales bacterium]